MNNINLNNIITEKNTPRSRSKKKNEPKHKLIDFDKDFKLDNTSMENRNKIEFLNKKREINRDLTEDDLIAYERFSIEYLNETQLNDYFAHLKQSDNFISIDYPSESKLL